MKMKRIANNVALQTIGYVISGAQITKIWVYIPDFLCYYDGA